MTQLHPIDAARRIEEQPETILLDVREPWEWEYCRLPGAVHIPLGVLPVRVNELDARKTAIVYCHHGSRSVFACSVLSRAGFTEVFNLYGGINAWTDFVDGSVKKY